VDTQTIVILDFGSQYTQLIARRIREQNVFSVVLPCTAPLTEIQALQPLGLILSGGPSSVYDADAPAADPRLLALGVPILGICYGLHFIVHHLGGKVRPGQKREYGQAEVTIEDTSSPLFAELPPTLAVWMSHGDTVFAPPPEFEALAHTENCPVAAFRHKTKPIYGLQWHPEVIHTPNGMRMLQNFIFQVCKCQANWQMEDLIGKMVKELKTETGASTAIIGLSGGIDSSVATALAAQALGEKLTAVFVDHGFMREGEPEQIRETFQKYPIKFIVANVQDRFMAKLKGVVEPEMKRKVIGEEFIRVFEEIANDTGTAFGQNGEATSSMGPVFADFEGRGVLDLWVTDGHYNRFLRNQANGSFEDVGASNGISQANAQYVSWGTGVYDFDNDGYSDILIFHGGLIHLIPQEHTLFRGRGNGRFEDVSLEAGPVLSQRTVARGACFADFMNDGKVDAYLVNLGAPGTLLRNVSTHTGHWIEIKLAGAKRAGDRSSAAGSPGAKSNRDGIGARVEVFAGGKRWTAERVASSGYLSQDDGRLHFGLGAATKIDKILIHWPSKREQTLENVKVDRILTIEEPK